MNCLLCPRLGEGEWGALRALRLKQFHPWGWEDAWFNKSPAYFPIVGTFLKPKAPQNSSWRTLLDLWCDICTTNMTDMKYALVAKAEMCFTLPWHQIFIWMSLWHMTPQISCNLPVACLGISFWMKTLWKVGTEANYWSFLSSHRQPSIGAKASLRVSELHWTYWTYGIFFSRQIIWASTVVTTAQKSGCEALLWPQLFYPLALSELVSTCMSSSDSSAWLARFWRRPLQASSSCCSSTHRCRVAASPWNGYMLGWIHRLQHSW